MSFGVNLGSFGSALSFPAVTSSTFGTTQMDSGNLNLGKITNTGMFVDGYIDYYNSQL
jgi:hypothetical protein